MKALLCTGLLYLTLLHVHIPSMVTATRIFCQAPPVREGDPANLICHFPEDLNQSRKGIAVFRRDSIPGSRDEFLLGCVWDNRKLVCGVFDGYRLLTPHPMYDVTFQIPSHEPGTFRCVYISADEAVTVESCNLTLKATRTFCRVPPVPEGGPANLICHYPEDLSQSRKDIIVYRRDSTPGSRDEFLIGCTWIKEKLVCGVRDEIKLITRQPMYDVTFQIAPLQPGTFRCHTTPEDEAVTVQSCNFTSKGNDSSRDTIERSQRRNEDADRRDVTNIAFAVVFPVIAALAVTFLIVLLCWLCWSWSSSGAARFVPRVTKRIKFHASPVDPQHGTVESQPQVVEEEAHSSESASPLFPQHGKVESQYQVVEEEVHWSWSSSGAARFVPRVTKRIKFHASPVDPQHGTVESEPQVVEEEAHSSESASPLFPHHGKVENQYQVVEEEAQSCLTHNCSTTDDDHGTD